MVQAWKNHRQLDEYMLPNTTLFFMLVYFPPLDSRSFLHSVAGTALDLDVIDGSGYDSKFMVALGKISPAFYEYLFFP